MHRPPAWNTLLPCSTCLPSNAAVLSAAASVKSFNLLHVFPYTEPFHWQQSNMCKTSKLSSCSQLHEENNIKESLCLSSSAIWSGRALQNWGRGGLTVENELSAPRRAVLVYENSTGAASALTADPLTGCIEVKERCELHHGTWCSKVMRAGCKPGEVIKDKD